MKTLRTPLLVLLLALAVLFNRTWRCGEVFSPADVLDSFYPWAYEHPRHEPTNPTRSDEALYHQPLMVTHWARLSAGEFPEWDPAVLGGVPAFHQGLDVGRAFSPLSLPFYLFRPDIAVTVYAPLRLLCAGLLMWLYLRAAGLSPPAQAAGAVAFALNGAFIVWLSAPMPTVALWLPLLALAVERTCQDRRVRDAALLALAVGLQFLGAYLPTSIVVMTVAGVWAGGWLVSGALASTPRPWRPAWLLAGGGTMGVLLGAIALGPMLATLVSSPAGARSVATFTLPWQNLATFALPDFWGSPTAHNWWYPGNGNYPEFVTYLGIPTLALAAAGAAMAVWTRDLRGLLALVTGTFALMQMYGWPPASWATVLPGLRQMNPHRWNVALAFATAVLAAQGLHHLVSRHRDSPYRFRRPALGGQGPGGNAPAPGAPADLVKAGTATAGRPSGEARPGNPVMDHGDGAFGQEAMPRVGARARWRAAPAAAAGVTALVALALASAAAMFSQLDIIRRLGLQGFEKRQIAAFGVTSLASALLLLATAAGRWRWQRAVPWLVPLVIAADLVHAGYGFNPTLPPDRLYPETPGIEFLQRTIDDARLAPIGSAHMLPQSHVWGLYGLPTITGFDFFGDRSYQRFIARAGGDVTPSAAPRWDYVGLEDPETVNLRLLGLLGVTLLVTPPVDVVTRAAGYTTVGELTNGRVVAQTFVVRDNGLRRIDLLAATFARQNDGWWELSLFDAAEETATASWRVEVAALRDLDWLRLDLPSQLRSAGRRYRLEIRASHSAAGRAATLLATPEGGLNQATLELDGRPDPRALWLRTFATAPDRIPGATSVYARDLNIYRNPLARPRAWFVSEVRVRPEPQHLAAIEDLGPHLDTVAVVDRPVQAPSGSRAGRVLTIMADQADRRSFRIDAPDGGILVLGERFDPHWRLAADGRPVPLVRADAVLMAAAIPPGTRLVTLDYSRPDWAYALVVSGLALLGILIAFVGYRRSAEAHAAQ